ncbi:MAG: tRNA (N6-isopentenyl adenosine(37)-C2)-methylthiotransferase MiaB [Rhodobacteraceae bacterium]|nr:tRNA (N6-isopentenyl adenosine(37)-C2)-methylthiotransferase MiaB [Paracoccaceae bacterium]MDB4229715.1 tRNA (N6-isopentenyl adenosine(37)-C2)-methylthiotransferase MiaB [Paracoccaceae bacterium]|tara:strand:+ start:465 stop:1784 length:1320 start_codon:yes stop_codon:yes gene_type:complete
MTVEKKIFVKTYGCQMNVYDSERMISAMKPSGYVETKSAEDADLILLNTCHIREKAAEKIYSELGRMKSLKANKPDLKIGVAGCVAQAEGKEIMVRQPAVDLVVGPQSYHRLPTMMKTVNKGKRALDTEFPEEDKFDHLPTDLTKRSSPSAFLTVQEGCDKFCAFCVVPYTRGVEVSRSPEKIIDEANSLVDRGVVEINLLGQNVNAYSQNGFGVKFNLSKLIWKLSEIDGLKRIRFTTSHPNDMTEDLIEAHGSCSKLMPYLHLPVQSGSDSILKKMNRKHTADDYRKIIEKFRKVRPDLLLSGDFIVGFPGETDKDFLETLQLVKDIKYGQSYSFKYSSRPGTPAANREEVCESLKKDRLAELQLLLSKQQMDIQKSMIGKEVKVLFEKPGRLNNQMGGKSEYLHAVHVIGSSLKKGDIKSVKIINTEANSLGGVLI